MVSGMNQKDLHYLKLAFLIAEQSKCVRAKYGSVIVSGDGRIVGTGTNGKPRNSINDHVCYREGLPDNSPKANCCIHSEENAMLFTTPEECINATIYVSGIPCVNCLLLISQRKFERLVYYNGPNIHTGHKGDFDLDFYSKYGMTFQVIPVDHISEIIAS